MHAVCHITCYNLAYWNDWQFFNCPEKSELPTILLKYRLSRHKNSGSDILSCIGAVKRTLCLESNAEIYFTLFMIPIPSFRRLAVISVFRFITKTHLYKFDPLKPHFYIVKLGFTGVYIIFLISAQRHRLLILRLWILLRTASMRRF